MPNNFEIGLSQIFSTASAIVAVSDFAANQLRDRFSDTGSRVHRIYNGIDCDSFQSAEPSLPRLIISIGRLISKKGFDVLIDACASLRNSGQEFRCEIIGDGPLSAELQARIDRYGLGKQVLLAGPRSQAEIAARLGRATLLVLPCRVDADGAMDNLPTAIMEAMACALPVVSTDVGGVAEMVRDGETGLLVSQNDPIATAEALNRLIRIQNSRNRLAARVANVQKKSFRSRKMCGRCGRFLRCSGRRHRQQDPPPKPRRGQVPNLGRAPRSFLQAGGPFCR